MGGQVLSSVELFSGGGGLASAMHRSGFRHLLVNELERRACETLRANSVGPLVDGDVRAVDFTALEGTVDVVAGGVPCQPWSLGGAHKGPDDARNLWPELFRCVRETRPKAVLAENVRGLLRPSFEPYYSYILRELALPFERRVDGEDWRDHDKRLIKALSAPRLGDDTERYDVFRLPVNAADHGVPQVRRRVFVVAFRHDLGFGDWQPPTPTHSETALAAAQVSGEYWDRHGLTPRPPVVESNRTPDGLQPWRTLRDAIADLPEPLPDRAEHPGWLHHYGWPGARSYKGHTPNELDRPAKTVKAGVHGVPGGESVLRRDDGSLRYLTVREVARIMTFPDEWRLAGPRGEQMRQLGNAVPVLLGEVMAAAIHRTLLNTS
ncbi:DNA cytosine methyltransferase [Pseudonocardia spinosispora]|uniref:DNA cytosine methyltransferase n=1 Tax=Pseudonocardia spinosispora TaxID=103441 RepID=UPI0004905EB5|nr:DNA cytosine methyltransferase [Pseudonocardia spinosispora]